jgi:hypothetical protein
MKNRFYSCTVYEGCTDFQFLGHTSQQLGLTRASRAHWHYHRNSTKQRVCPQNSAFIHVFSTAQTSLTTVDNDVPRNNHVITNVTIPRFLNIPRFYEGMSLNRDENFDSRLSSDSTLKILVLIVLIYFLYWIWLGNIENLLFAVLWPMK